MQENQGIASFLFESGIPDWVHEMNALGDARTPFFFLLDFECKAPVIIPLAEMEANGILVSFPNYESIKPFEAEYLPFELTPNPVSFETYEAAFAKAMQAIRDGDTYLLNLTFATPVSGDIDLYKAYYISKAKYKVYWPDRFVVFSPESFVSIKDAVIRTFPMKGTIDADMADAENALLKDLKEQEEHATVVDLLRNDLSMVADQVTVERYRFISKINARGKTLLQTSTEISGQLHADYISHPGDIFMALLPAGSVTGAPKKRTVELIKEIEPESRAYYTGIAGVYDGESLESAVMIRMIERRGDGYFYRSGGGITYQSEVRAEYQELIDKIYIPLP